MKRAVAIIVILAALAFWLGRYFPVGLPDQRVPTTITESTQP